MTPLWLQVRRLEERFPAQRGPIVIARAQARGASPLLQLGLGAGLTVSAAFLCAAIGGDTYGVLGLGLAIAASVASWLALEWWMRPIELGGVLLARAMIATTFDEPLPYVAVEVVLFFAHRDPVNRVIAAAGALLALSMARPEAVGWLVLGALTAATAIAVSRAWWATAPSVAREPLWYGALGLLAYALIGPALPETTFGTSSAAILGGLAAGAAGAVASAATTSWVDRIAAVAFPLALAAFTATVPGVMVALVVGALGFRLRSPAVWAAGVLSFAGYGTFFMYDLEWGLVAKGGGMIATGVVLALGGWLAGRGGDR